MERERPPERLDDAPPAEAPEAPRVVVRSPGDEAAAAADRRDAAIAWALILAGGVVATLVRPDAHPVAWSLGLSVSLAFAVDRLALAPVVRLARLLGAETARLRAALACPYCKDALPEAAAIACDRKGCGAFYHEECWAECGASYGGCAIYGCGSRSGHLVGRFALQRHVLRVLVAAALFPPRLVKRIQEGERQSFREVWRQAREYQRDVSHSAARTLLVGGANAAVCVGIALVVAARFSAWLDEVRRPGRWWFRVDEGIMWFAALSLVLCVLPVVLMRVPLAAHFAWGVKRLVGRIFRDELAALRRADEGTFLARLAGGAGKKD
ncbi:MAG: hypothetical protein KF878_14085 [Planctomycetes bacterium]|nr:hypothetical protein [Planctomycetota bacterium]